MNNSIRNIVSYEESYHQAATTMVSKFAKTHNVNNQDLIKDTIQHLTSVFEDRDNQERIIRDRYQDIKYSVRNGASISITINNNPYDITLKNHNDIIDKILNQHLNLLCKKGLGQLRQIEIFITKLSVSDSEYPPVPTSLPQHPSGGESGCSHESDLDRKPYDM